MIPATLAPTSPPRRWLWHIGPPIAALLLASRPSTRCVRVITAAVGIWLGAGCDIEPCLPDDPRPACAERDGGVGACWNPVGQPIETTARVEPSVRPGVLGCDRLEGGECVAGPLVARYGHARAAECLPATSEMCRT